MNAFARTTLSTITFIFLIMGSMNLVGWADTPEWTRDFAVGFYFATMVAFLGTMKRKPQEVAPQGINRDAKV